MRSRGFAALIAVLAFAGLVLQFDALRGGGRSPGLAAWVTLRYFTNWTSILVALVFARIARDPAERRRVWLLGGAVFASLLVGVVNALLLHGLSRLNGRATLADLLPHVVTPIATLLYWFAYAPKGALRPRDPLLWALFPIAYLVYALGRGLAERTYAYPFIDVAALGWGRTALNIAGIAGGFLLAGWLFVRLDRRRAGTAQAPAAARLPPR